MKFAIDIGHNTKGDTGAQGIKNEDELTSAVGEKLIDLLIKHQHLVTRCAPSSAVNVSASLRHRVSIANHHDCDIFVSIHFNALNTKCHGSEVYAMSRAGAAIGQSILDEIVKLGFYNRGVKSAPFYVLKYTSMPAVLVECCFCDNYRDMSLFDVDDMAQAIFTGLTGEIPSEKNNLTDLVITDNTWLKDTIEQSYELDLSEKTLFKPGEYKVLSFLPEEEGHYWVRLLNGEEGFLYAGHCQII